MEGEMKGSRVVTAHLVPHEMLEGVPKPEKKRKKSTHEATEKHKLSVTVLEQGESKKISNTVDQQHL